MASSKKTGIGGKWIPAACWHNCGGRCLLQAYVKDGKVIRVKTDDTHPDNQDNPQLRACARGRSQIGQVFGADRLKYPMKRKHWAPGGGKKELRGKDEWIRISWDEALDIAASETKRILDAHGNKSLLVMSWEEGENSYFDPTIRVFSRLGGFIRPWGTVSLGGWPFPSIFMTGGFWDGNDRMDLLNSELIVLWGNNPIVNRHGNMAYLLLQAKKNGARIIFIDPMYNESARALADEWIPVQPGTDAALLLGVAYHMIAENLHDQNFLDNYTIGFDAAHMPKGSDPKDNFKDYVLGSCDGIPKTPEWASKICGTEPDVIKRLAVQMATVKPASMISAWAAARSNRGEQFAQAFFTVAWMTGNIGIPGGQATWSGTPYGGRSLIDPGPKGDKAVENALFPKKSSIGGFFPNPLLKDWHALNWSECWEAVLSGEYTAGIRGKQPIDIRMIYHGTAAALNQMPGINKGIEAHRKVEFVVSASQFLGTNAKYADLVFPVTTMWERSDEIITTMPLNTENVLYWQNVIEPMYEARDDMFIARGLAERFGIDPDEIEGPPKEQQLYNQLAGTVVIREDGSGYEPLLSITGDDIKEMGVEGNSQTGRMPLAEFREKGIYQVPRKPGDRLGYIAFEAFRDDPEANPVKTATGKLEIYCQTLADMVNAYGWSKLDPIPRYEPEESEIEESDAADYPLKMITPHHLRRAHSTMDNVPYLREAFPQECWVNNLDAQKRGIKTNDTILVTSPHGALLRRAKVTPCIVPGVVGLADGAWVDKDEKTGIDKGGAPNSVQAPKPHGHGIQTWNSCRIEIEKYDLPLRPDHMWPQRIVFQEG